MNKILGLILASGLGGCVGESYSRYTVTAGCDRMLQVCLHGECYYCAEADLNVARGCIETTWIYRDGTDPLENLAERRADVLRYGSSATVAISALDKCSRAISDPRLGLEGGDKP